VFYKGKEVISLTMTLKSGKVTELTAKAGGERLLESAGPGKKQFAVVDIGINPNVRIPKNSKMLVFMAAGMVSGGIGNDTWASGDNTASFSAGGFMQGSMLKMDGKVVVEEGALKL
jgi:hypothetical protein